MGLWPSGFRWENVRKLMASVGWLAAGIVIFLASVPHVLALQSASLGWSASPDPRTTGYTVVYGTSSGAYTQSTNVGNVTQAIVSGLAEGTTYYFNVYAYGGTSLQSDLANEVSYTAPASVVSRLIFYNNSAWDGNDATANANDDAAIAPDKTALFLGGIASFSNYTSYSRGINGVMVDIAGLPGTPTASDFQFKVGNDNNPSGWTAAPTPSSVTVRAGAGSGGSARVTIIWPDNAIQKQWIEVTVQATANTGLASPDVFYFGNAVGETGNSSTDAFVNGTDESASRANPHGFLNPASLTCPYDFNRDKLVNGTDISILRANATGILNSLRLINLTSALANFAGGGTGSAGSSPMAALASTVGQFTGTPVAMAVISNSGAGAAAQPIVLKCQSREPGRLEIQFVGPATAGYRVQVTDDPERGWRDTEGQAESAGSYGVLRVSVPILSQTPRQFYRIYVDNASAN
jgi:hypothetical protein